MLKIFDRPTAEAAFLDGTISAEDKRDLRQATSTAEWGILLRRRWRMRNDVLIRNGANSRSLTNRLLALLADKP